MKPEGRWWLGLGCGLICAWAQAGVGARGGAGLELDPAPVEGAGKYHVVILSDRAGLENYQVLTDPELKALQAAIQVESGLFIKAMRATQLAWRRHVEHSRRPFPRAAIHAIKLVSVATYPSFKAADGRRAAMEEERDVLQKKEAARSRSELQAWDRRMSKLYHRKPHAPPKRTLTKAELQREAAEERVRNRYKDDARLLFDETLGQLVQAAAPTAGTAAGGVADGVEGVVVDLRELD